MLVGKQIRLIWGGFLGSEIIEFFDFGIYIVFDYGVMLKICFMLTKFKQILGIENL